VSITLRRAKHHYVRGAIAAFVVAAVAVIGSGVMMPAAYATTASNGPQNTSAPTITGFTEVGRTLFASSGAWIFSAGEVPTISYQWGRTASGSVADIPVATSPQYLVQPADEGSTLYVLVTDTSTAGSTTLRVDTTTITAAQPRIEMTDFNVVSLNPQTLLADAGYSTTTGTWTGASDLTFTYRWFVGTQYLGSISGDGLPDLTAGFYLRPTTQLLPLAVIPYQARGLRIYAIITAHSNMLGSAYDATNGDYGDVIGPLPSGDRISSLYGGGPSFAGTPTVGRPMSVTQLPDYNRQPDSVSYTWYTYPTNTSDTVVSGLKLVGTGSVYTPVAADAGSYLYVEISAVTATFGTDRITGHIGYVARADGSMPPPVVPPAAPFASDAGIVPTNQGGVSGLQVGNTVTVTIPGAQPGDQVFVYGYSTPTPLGFHRVNTSKQVSVGTSGLPAGAHHLVVLSAAGVVIGWTAISVPTSVTSPATITTPVMVDALAATGFDANPWVAAALLLLLSGLILRLGLVHRRQLSAR
jgi:hypothetical protein